VGIWTPSTFAQAGLYISNTSIAGRIYELSSEHHVRNEVVLDHVSNWQIYALQTEEERGEGSFAMPLDIRNSSNITFANLHMYRVVSSYQPFKYAVTVTNSKKIRFATSTAIATAKYRSTVQSTIKPTILKYGSANSPGSRFPEPSLQLAQAPHPLC